MCGFQQGNLINIKTMSIILATNMSLSYCLCSKLYRCTCACGSPSTIIYSPPPPPPPPPLPLPHPTSYSSDTSVLKMPGSLDSTTNTFTAAAAAASEAPPTTLEPPPGLTHPSKQSAEKSSSVASPHIQQVTMEIHVGVLVHELYLHVSIFFFLITGSFT